MAKKVNTRFLAFLVGAVILVGGGMTGVYIWIVHYEHDPVRLERKAKEALAGKHYVAAVQAYQQAVVAAMHSHNDALAARLALDLGDLQYKYSNLHRKWLNGAVSAWQTAVHVVPTDMAAQNRLLRFYKKYADFAPEPAKWRILRQQADTIVKLDPKDAEAYELRGWSRLNEMTGLVAITDTRFQTAANDLKKAVALDPSNAQAVFRLAQTYRLRAAAEHSQHLITRVQADKLDKQALALVEGFVKKYPDNVQGWLNLAQVYAGAKATWPQANAALTQAQKLAPKSALVLRTQFGLASLQGASYRQQESLLQQILQLEPTHTQGYLELGQFYRQHGHYNQSVKYLQAARAHPTPGGGMAAIKIPYYQAGIHAALASDYLTLAQGQHGKQRTTLLSKAEKNIHWVASRNPHNAWVLVHTGELQLSRGQVADALTSLQQAETLLVVGASAQQNKLWFQDKQLQAQAYDLLGQSGLALKQLNDILAKFPGAAPVQLARAGLTLREHPHAALAIANQVLAGAPQDQAAVVIKAQALAALNDPNTLQAFLAHRDTSSNLQLAQLKAQVQMLRQNYAGAWTTLKPWVVKAPAMPQVVLPAFEALLKLNRRLDAASVIRRAQKAQPDSPEFIMLANQLAKPNAQPPIIHFGALGSNTLTIQIPGMTQAAAYRQAIESIPDPVVRAIQLAQYDMQQKDYAGAKAALATAEKIKPDSLSLLQTSFQLALASKDFTTAGKLVQVATAKNADGVNGALYHGQLQLAQKDYSGAIGTLTAGLQQAPNNVALLTACGLAQLQTGDVTAGVSSLSHAIEINPGDLLALKGLIGFYLQNNSAASISRAAKLVDQALSYAPSDPQLHQWNDNIQDLYGPPGPAIKRRLAILKKNPGDLDNIERLSILYAREKRFARAVRLLKPAVTANPSNYELAAGLARLYLMQNQVSNARAVYDNLAESSDAATAYVGRLYLAELYEGQHDFAQAIQMYKSALKKQPSKVDAVQRRLGDLYVILGQYQKALGYYAPLYKHRPNDRVVILRYIETLIRAGHVKKAQQMLTAKVFAKNPSDEQGLVLAALAERASGHLHKALTLVDQALAVDPRNTHTLNGQNTLDPTYINALRSQATIDSQIPGGDLQQGIRDMLLVVHQNPDDLRSRRLLASLYFATHQYAEAVQELHGSLRRNPDDSLARLMLIRMLFPLSQQFAQLKPGDESDTAVTLRMLNPGEQLATLLQQSLSQFPHEPLWRQWQAQFDLAQGHKTAALANMRRAYIMAGRSTDAAIAYGQMLLNTAHYQHAIKIASAALAVAPNVPALLAVRAQANAQSGQKAAAQNDYQALLKLVSHNAAASVAAIHAMQQYVGTQPTLAAATALQAADPKNQVAALGLANAQFLANNFTGALATSEAILAAQPDPTVNAQAVAMAGIAAYEAGQYSVAEKYYKQALQINPDNVEVLNNLAYLLAVKLKHPHQGLSYAEKSNQLAANAQQAGPYAHDPNLLDTLGWLRYLTGDTEGAVSALERSTRYGSVSTAYYHLAIVRNKQGHRTEAEDDLRKAISLAQSQNNPKLQKKATALLSQWTAHAAKPG